MGQTKRKEKGSTSTRKKKPERLNSIDHSVRKRRSEKNLQEEDQTET